MSLALSAAPGSKKALAKKQGNPGTFKVENPKKMKKVSHSSNSEDTINKKKKRKENKTTVADLNGAETKNVAQAKKRPLKQESNDAPVPKKARALLSAKKQSVKESDGDDLNGRIQAKIKKRSFDGDNKNSGKPLQKKAKFSSGKSQKSFLKSKKGFIDNSKKSNSISPATSEKPDWNKLKEEKKELREKRRAAQKNADSYEVSIEARKILEGIRSKKCPAAEQIKQLQNLYSLLKGKFLLVVYAHDMSRVVETMLKFAHHHKQVETFDKIFQELVPEVVEMSKRKYATHVVRSMIAHSSPKQRTDIVKAFHGRVVKLLCHKIGSVVLEQLYVKCKPEDQHDLKKELYGGSQKLIASECVTGLGLIFDKLPNMKESTLTNTKEILTGLFEKSVVSSHIVHSVLLDFLGFANPEDSSELLSLARKHVKALTQSKEGVHVAMMCVWMGTPKERKKIVKELKEGFVNLATGEHTHMLLLAIFDSLDDTVFVQKAVLIELLAGDLSLSPLLNSTYGRKVLMYLCSRRDPRMFSAPIVATLATGDSNPHSKKEANVRASELQKFAVPLLMEHIAQNTKLWMENNSNLLVLQAAVKVGFGDKLTIALKAIARHVASPPGSKENGIDLRVADNSGCHMVLKKLAQNDKVLAETHEATFGEALLAELTDEHFKAWLKNNHCCFLLLEVLKNTSAETAKKLRIKIKNAAAFSWKKKDQIPAGGKRIQEVL